MNKMTCILALGLASSPALVTAAAADARGVSVTGMIETFPVGTMQFEGLGTVDTESTAFAYGVGAQIQYRVSDALAVGLAPRYIFNVVPSDSDADVDAGSQLDLALRVEYSRAVNARTTLFGFLAPGYSTFRLPATAEIPDPAGLVLGLGGGGRYAISETLFAQAELGYMRGFQHATIQGMDATFSTDFLHIGVGAGTTFR